MAGYAVSVRIDGVAPRRVRPVSARLIDDGLAVPFDEDAWPDLATRPMEPDLAERWEMFRERWSQLTFFLFDAESWRA